MRIEKYTATGINNQKRSYSTQDRIWTGKKAGVRVMAISDGAGSCKYSGEAAECAARCAGEYWLKNRRYIMSAGNTEIADLTMTVVRYHLKKEAAERGIEYLEQCCTLIMSMTELDSGETLTLHIGDGSIYNCNGGRLCRISCPENDRSLNETYFAVCEDSSKHCRVNRVSIGDGLLMCTDGLDMAFRKNRSLSGELSRSLIHDPERVDELLSSVEKLDDTSFISLFRS